MSQDMWSLLQFHRCMCIPIFHFVANPNCIYKRFHLRCYCLGLDMGIHSSMWNYPHTNIRHLQAQLDLCIHHKYRSGGMTRIAGQNWEHKYLRLHNHTQYIGQRMDSRSHLHQQCISRYHNWLYRGLYPSNPHLYILHHFANVYPPV